MSKKMDAGFLPVNVGSPDRLKVSRIAQILIDALGLPDTRIRYTGDARGWDGDVVKTDMDISLLQSYGWAPQFSAEDAILSQIKWLVDDYGSIDR
ncbi:hypothetical protein EU522_00785 [Candidatus Thorarchaeota archaeon]|nr:MAG: hypothetical protein EU522_00785 [Candidatus Thorarchaeota archaeon]